MLEVPTKSYKSNVDARTTTTKIRVNSLVCKGKNCLMSNSDHSIWFELEQLPQTTSETIMEALAQMFAKFKVPDIVQSDKASLRFM